MVNLGVSDAVRPGSARIAVEFHEPSSVLHHRPRPAARQRTEAAALTYLNEAWAEARHDGVDGDCLAQASLFAAFAELVGTYGEDAVAKFVEGLPLRVAMANSRFRWRSSRARAPSKAIIASRVATKQSTTLLTARWIASRSLSSAALRADPLARNDEETFLRLQRLQKPHRLAGRRPDQFPCHITRRPLTKVPTGQPVTRTPS
jgi:hypothetical protein